MDTTDIINFNEYEYDPRMEYDDGVEFVYLDNDSKITVAHNDEVGGTT